MNKGSFVDGFATGWGLTDKTVARVNREKLAQEKLEQDHAWQNKQLALQEKRLALAQDRQNQEEEWRRKQWLRQDWLDQNAEMDREEAADQQAFENRMLEKNFKLNKGLTDAKTMKAINELSEQYLSDYARSGVITEDGARALAHSAYAGTFRALNGIKDKATSVLSGYESIKTPEQLLQYANQKDTLDVVNATMSNELYSREKTSGNKYEIVALEPMPGGVTPVFKITTPDGKVITERAPATRRKSSDKDDEVMVIPIQEMKKKIVEGFRFFNYADKDPMLKKILMPSDGEYKASGGVVLNTATGEYERIDNGLSQSKIDEMYSKYINSVASGFSNQEPVPKSEWMIMNGFSGAKGGDGLPQPGSPQQGDNEPGDAVGIWKNSRYGSD